jgi:hypothetical protein
MDIILDTNSYYSLINSSGRNFTTTNIFVELVTYLRRTKSDLVIPAVTFNEITARYRDMLRASAKETQDAWSTLQRQSMSGWYDFEGPDIDDEVSQLQKYLLRPTPGFTSRVYDNYSRVRIEEVVQRGIDRIRPANDRGEELRDVVVWLMAVEFAKESKRELAFISDDNTFKDEDGDLHPHLKEDIKRAAAKITYYHSIRKFVAANSLASEPMTPEQFAAVVNSEEILALARDKLLQARLRQGVIKDVDILRMELIEAQKYLVGEGSFYIEAQHKGECSLRTIETRLSYPAVTHAVTGAPWLSGGTNVAAALAAATPVSFFSNAFLNPGLPASVPSYAQMFGTSGPLTIASTQGWLSQGVIQQEVEVTYRSTFNTRLSVRIANGTRESLELDSLELKDLAVAPTSAGSSA